MSSKKTKQGYKLVKWYFGKEIQIPEEWNNTNVEYVANKLFSGGTPSTDISKYWNGNIPWTKGAVLSTSYITKGERFISKLGLENSSTSIIPKDNLLVVSRVSIGNVSINKIDIAINQDITAIILDKSKCLTEFLYWNLLKAIGTLVLFSQGTTIQGFTRKDLSDHKILLPPLQEQQNIASILSRVDALIESTQNVIEKTERLKKGMMQKLLTRGIGHTKFKKVPWFFGKEIEIPEEWEIKSMNTICKVRQGLQIPISERFIESGKNRLQYITVKSIHSNNFEEFIEDAEKRVICDKDNVLFTRTGNTGEIITNIKGVFHNNFFLIDYNKELMIKDYIIYFLKQNKIQNMIRSLAGSTTIPDLNHGDFYRLLIIISSKKEQQKIASILSGVDAYIQKTQEYKEKLDILKRGLMQKLLTGQIRV